MQRLKAIQRPSNKGISMTSIKINPQKQSDFKRVLEESGFDFLPHQYAFWRAKKGKTTVIFYEKGTLLIQGSESECKKIQNLLFYYPSPLVKESNKKTLLSLSNLTRTIGMDESGKGDCFGPLVLAAAIVDKSLEQKIQKFGVTDSKKLPDSRILSLSETLKSLIPNEVRVILPGEYNPLYSKTKNLNLLLTQEYRNLLRKMKTSNYNSAILDDYSLSAKQKQLIHQAADMQVLIIKEAEQYPSVAAASILARAAFVSALRNLEKQNNLSLPKGSGLAAQEKWLHYRKTMSEESFARIAKTHFKIHGKKS